MEEITLRFEDFIQNSVSARILPTNITTSAIDDASSIGPAGESALHCGC
jgi:hypothetical protein